MKGVSPVQEMQILSHPIRYRYRCERCGYDTDWFDSTIQYTHATNRRLNRANWLLTQEQLQKMEEEAEAGLSGLIGRLRKAIGSGGYEVLFEGDPLLANEYNQVFSEGATCPYCGERQTWYPATAEKPSGAGGAVLWALLLTVACLAIGFAYVHLLPGAIPASIPATGVYAAYGAAAVCVGSVIGYARAKSKEIEKISYYTSAPRKERPEVDWNGK